MQIENRGGEADFFPFFARVREINPTCPTRENGASEAKSRLLIRFAVVKSKRQEKVSPYVGDFHTTRGGELVCMYTHARARNIYRARVGADIRLRGED